MKFIYKFILLLFISILSQNCERLNLNKPESINTNIVNTNLNPVAMNRPVKVSSYITQDIFHNINLNLTDQEKDIIRILIVNNFKPEKIKFSLQNLEISYTNIENTYNAEYYINLIEKDSALKAKVIQGIKEIFKSSLHFSENENNNNEDNIKEITLLKKLPLRESDQLILANHINPENEPANPFLQDNNINVYFKFAERKISIIFKQTYYYNWLNQKINFEQLKMTSNTQFDMAKFTLDLSHVKISLFSLLKFSQNVRFKNFVDHITYGNLFYYLSNTNMHIMEISSILNNIQNISYNDFKFSNIQNISTQIDPNNNLEITIVRNKDKILSNFLKSPFNIKDFKYEEVLSERKIKLNLPIANNPILNNPNILTMIKDNPATNSLFKSTYGNFFYYLLNKNKFTTMNILHEISELIGHINNIHDINVILLPNSLSIQIELLDINQTTTAKNNNLIVAKQLLDTPKTMNEFINAFEFKQINYSESVLEFNFEKQPFALTVAMLEALKDPKYHINQQNGSITYGNLLYHLLNQDVKGNQRIKDHLNSMFKTYYKLQSNALNYTSVEYITSIDRQNFVFTLRQNLDTMINDFLKKQATMTNFEIVNNAIQFTAACKNEYPFLYHENVINTVKNYINAKNNPYTVNTYGYLLYYLLNNDTQVLNQFNSLNIMTIIYEEIQRSEITDSNLNTHNKVSYKFSLHGLNNLNELLNTQYNDSDNWLVFEKINQGTIQSMFDVHVKWDFNQKNQFVPFMRNFNTLKNVVENSSYEIQGSPNMITYGNIFHHIVTNKINELKPYVKVLANQTNSLTLEDNQVDFTKHEVDFTKHVIITGNKDQRLREVLDQKIKDYVDHMAILHFYKDDISKKYLNLYMKIDSIPGAVSRIGEITAGHFGESNSGHYNTMKYLNHKDLSIIVQDNKYAITNEVNDTVTFGNLFHYMLNPSTDKEVKNEAKKKIFQIIKLVINPLLEVATDKDKDNRDLVPKMELNETADINYNLNELGNGERYITMEIFIDNSKTIDLIRKLNTPLVDVADFTYKFIIDGANRTDVVKLEDREDHNVYTVLFRDDSVIQKKLKARTTIVDSGSELTFLDLKYLTYTRKAYTEFLVAKKLISASEAEEFMNFRLVQGRNLASNMSVYSVRDYNENSFFSHVKSATLFFFTSHTQALQSYKNRR